MAKDVRHELGETEATIYTGCNVCEVVLASDVEPGFATQVAEAAARVDRSARVDQRTARQNLTEEGTSDLQDAGTAAWTIGLSALALSLIGAFGVLSYTVEERRREMDSNGPRGSCPYSERHGRQPAGVLVLAQCGGAMLVATLLAIVVCLTPFDPAAYPWFYCLVPRSRRHAFQRDDHARRIQPHRAPRLSVEERSCSPVSAAFGPPEYRHFDMTRGKLKATAMRRRARAEGLAPAICAHSRACARQCNTSE